MQKNNSFFVTVVAVVVLAVAGMFAFKKFKSPSAPTAQEVPAVAERPITLVPFVARTTQPFDEYTKYFAKKSYRVTGAGPEFFAPEQNVQYDLPYYWFQPAGAPYPPGLKFPLVLVLHGGGGNAYAGKYLIQQDMQVKYPAFIMAPVLPQTWLWSNAGQVQGHPEIKLSPRLAQGLPGTVRLIKSLLAEYPIDPKRIYVIGCSEGGMGAFGAVRHYPDVFAAAMPLSGVWNANDAPKMTGVPMWIMQGGADTVIPADVPRMVANIAKKNGGDVAYTELAEMGHNCPSSFLYGEPTWKWLFSHVKK